MNKHVLIVENATESLRINESNKTGKVILNGIFTEFDVENRNKRFYRADNFIPCMESLLKKKEKLGVLYGEFDHPDVFDITGKNISHAIEDMQYNESMNRIDGSIALLSTHWGKEARAIVNDGFPLFVSSRAAGMTDANGVVALKELFTYDIVVDPGFASARVSINESMGYKADDVPYRIYEMKDTHVNDLFNDNKNDRKTGNDLSFMKEMIQNELAKLEHQMVSKGKGISQLEFINLTEKYESLNEELKNVNQYLSFIQGKVNFLIKENTKLTQANKQLTDEINENISYANHLSSAIKNVNTVANTIQERLDVSEKMVEYVAENLKNSIDETTATVMFVEDLAKNTKAIYEDLKVQGSFVEYIAQENKVTQLFTENVASELNITQKFAENNANELKVTQLFVENNASELNVTQKFVENNANELFVTQKFAEYTANENMKNDVFHTYIAEKVDGIIGYNSKLVESLKTNKAINESLTQNELPEIEDYLGLEDELEIINNVQEEFEFDENTEDDTTVDEVEPVTDDTIIDDTIIDDTIIDDTIEDQTQEIDTDFSDLNTDIDTAVDSSIESELLSSLVRILGSDDTGVVIEITPDNKVIIQKSGSDETLELSEGEYEPINTEENVTETVANVLAEMKKQKVLANQQPHFFSFLSEEQIADFKAFDNETKEAVMLAMNESEYFTTSDVLSIIGETLNNKAMSYEEKLVSNIPQSLKESWNALPKQQKLTVIAESKYFNLVTSADFKNYWNTSTFGKSVNSPDAVLIKESFSDIKNDEGFSDDFINAFTSKF